VSGLRVGVAPKWDVDLPGKTRVTLEGSEVGGADAFVRLPEAYRVDERETLPLRGEGQ
jgi:hypothetical protein